MKIRQRSVVIFVLIALTIVAGVMIGGVMLDRFLDPFDDQPFDPVVWAAADAKERAPMARDAIRQLCSGLSKDRVRELLGKPGPFPCGPSSGSVDWFGNRLLHSETWSYYLGCWSSISWYGLDSAFLYVHFGPDGRVGRAEITGG